MYVNAVGAPSVLTAPAGAYAADEAERPFEYFLDSFKSLLAQTNDYQLTAERAQLEFAAGRTDDMLSVMLAQEKAYAALSFTVQVTNKAVEAYKEIMRLSM
jgi:flagellar hook-basal body complex protein FliE